MEELHRLAAYQQCSSLNGWVPVEVSSRSQPGVIYLVLVAPWGDVAENICECEGYYFRGFCAHQKIARQMLCGWTELGVRARQQTDSNRNLMICPECGQKTMWAFKRLEAGDRIAD